MANLALVIDPGPTIAGGQKVLNMLDRIEKKALRVSNVMARMFTPASKTMRKFESRLNRVEKKFKNFGKTQNKVQDDISRKSKLSSRSIGNLIGSFFRLFNVGGRAGFAMGEGAAAIGGLGLAASVTAGLILVLVAGLVAVVAAVFVFVAAIKALIAVTKFIITETIAWEKELVNVAKTANLTDRGIETLTKGIQGMLAVLPVTRTELLGIAEVAGQMGIQGVNNILRFTKAIAQLSLTSNIVGREGATAMARFLKVTGTGVRFVEELASVITALGNNYAATESEILNMTTQLAQNVAAFDVSAEKVLALSAVMKSLGIETEVGSSVVGRAFNEIANSVDKGGESLENLRKITGLTFNELKSLDDFDIFIKTLEGLRRVQEEGGNVSETLRSIGLEGVRNRKVLLTLANNTDQVADALGIANKEMENTTALFAEVSRRSDTADSSITDFKNSLTSSVVEFKDLAIVIKVFFNELTDLVSGFKSNTLESKNFKDSLRVLAGNTIKTIKITKILLEISIDFIKVMTRSILILSNYSITMGVLTASTKANAQGMIQMLNALAPLDFLTKRYIGKINEMGEILKKDPLSFFTKNLDKNTAALKKENEAMRKLNLEIRDHAKASDESTRALLRQENAQRRLSTLQQERRQVFRGPTSAVLSAAAGETDTEAKIRDAAKKLREIINEEFFLSGKDLGSDAVIREIERLVSEGRDRMQNLFELKNLAKDFRKNLSSMGKEVDKFFENLEKQRSKTLIKIESVFGGKAEAEASANLKKFEANLLAARDAEFNLIALARDAFREQSKAITESNDALKNRESIVSKSLAVNEQSFERLKKKIEAGNKELAFFTSDENKKDTELLAKAIANIGTSAASADRALSVLSDGDFGALNRDAVVDLVKKLKDLSNLSRVIQGQRASQNSIAETLAANERELTIITEQLNKALQANSQFTFENQQKLIAQAQAALTAQVALTKLSGTMEAFKQATEDSTKPLSDSIKTLNEELLKLANGGAFQVIEKQASDALSKIGMTLSDSITAANNALDKGAITVEQYDALILKLATDSGLAAEKIMLLKGDAERLTKTLEKQKLLKEVADTLGDSFANAFTDIISGTKSVSDAFRDMANDILKEVLRITVTRPLAQAISGGILSFAPGAPAPSGGTGGGATSGATFMANGGIVDQPTFMGFSGGRPAIAGEAGAEAVIPLTRVGGKLGISGKDLNTNTVNNKNVTVNMTVITKDADSMRRSKRQVVGGIKRILNE